jgi:hypothetical protein
MMSGPALYRASTGRATKRTWLVIAVMVVLGASVACPTLASPPSLHAKSLAASTSDAARRDAIKSIPLDKMAPEDRAKVESVLSSVSIFRRLPVGVTDCDPDLYLYLVRHPDIVINIWEVMKASRLQLRQLDENSFQLIEPAGTLANFEFVYQSHDMHVLYGEGTYEGPLIGRVDKGRGVLVLKCGYVRETNGRYYVTSRLDCFVSIEPAGAELLGKTVSPLLGKTVDNNFAQTVAFVGSLSHTAEANGRGMQRLATQLTHVRPEIRTRFAEVAVNVGRKSTTANVAEQQPAAETAARPESDVER